MDETEKKIRRSALKLIAISLALGFLLGLGAGALLVYHNTDRVVVVPLDQGIDV